MINRKQNTEFGILLALVLLIVSIFKPVSTGAIVVVLLISLLFPAIYAPFSWAWFKIGDFLGRIMTCALLSIVFYFIVLPVGVIRRMFGKDDLHIHSFKSGSSSVFENRDKKYQRKDLEKQY